MGKGYMHVILYLEIHVLLGKSLSDILESSVTPYAESLIYIWELVD